MPGAGGFGAMENWGAIFSFENILLVDPAITTPARQQSIFEVAAHEIAHQWFGDLVTMAWWDDLWLNESFAEWAAHDAASNATRFGQAWASFANQRKAWAYRQDQLPSTHPIAADMVDLDSVHANFDGITYAKGASVLKQLVAFVGREEFLTGVRQYFRTHAFGNTELADLLAALAAASGGRDLGGWAQEWLQTPGVNLIRPEVHIGPDGRYEAVNLLQEPPSAPAGVPQTLRAHALELGLYDIVDGRLELRRRTPVDVAGERTEVPALQGEPAADLLLVNDDDLTYAKIRLDPHSMGAAIDGLGTLGDPLARALIWGAAWDMTRDAELPTSEFVALIAGAIGSESDVGLVGQVLRQALGAVSMFADPSQRSNYCTMLAQSLLTAAEAAPPGSDHQLAYVRGLITFAGDAEIAFLRGLLTGSQILPGLAVDTDVRWSLVTRLVALGAAGEESVADQLLLDDTAAGRRRAATARAAAPDLAAKEAAWLSALDDPSLPNATLAATVVGIMQPFQGDLVRPFIERYFAALPTIVSERTHEIMNQVVTGLYPSLVVDASVVERTDVFLQSNPDFPSGVARLLVEGRDGLERSLRCLARDRDG